MWTSTRSRSPSTASACNGRYGLFPIGRGGRRTTANDWMIHRMDPPDRSRARAACRSGSCRCWPAGPPDRLPSRERDWSFEVKWDGVRAIAYVKPGRLRLESRNLREITDAYPEVRGLLRRSRHARGGARRRDRGLRRRRAAQLRAAAAPHARDRAERRCGACSATTPVVYAIFDLLYLDGHSLMGLPYEQRRERLEELEPGRRRRGGSRPPTRARAPRLLEATAAQGLEGVVAKRLDSRYEPGRRDRRLDQDQAHPAPGARDRRLAARRGPAHRADRRAADGPLRDDATAARVRRAGGDRLHRADARSSWQAAVAPAAGREPV